MIWIIGGTSDANEIARKLVETRHSVLLSVTTDYGRELAERTGANVLVEKLSLEQMNRIIQSKGIQTLIDASHPFACEVSENAIAAAKASKVRYIRFERPEHIFEDARYFTSYEEVTDYLSKTSGNILITTGSKYCARFLGLEPSRLFIRVLSTSESVEQCLSAGYKPEQIFAMKGISSVAFNEALMRELSIRYLVTKNSGTEGGLNEKITAALNLGAEVLIIRRPKIDYPNIFGSIAEIVEQALRPSEVNS